VKPEPMAGQAGGTPERRVVTALFCDVVGSTSIAEGMDPEDWSAIVGQTIAAMAGSVERYGGTVTQFAGDGILALFGAPIAHEDDPYRAIRAGVAIIEAVRSGRLQVRVGINTGLVVAGDFDAGDLNLYSALGDTLNVAARLQALAEPGRVVISEPTRALVANDVEVRPIGPTVLKGRSEPVEVYEVVSVRGSDERLRGISGLASPMIGRDTEMERLHELLTAAAAGTGRVVAILGEPGVGKSRLTEEFGASVSGFGAALWAVGRCVPYDDELPFHLISSLMRSLAGVTASDDPELIVKAITELSDTSGTPEAAGPLLKLVGLSNDDADDTPEHLQAEYAEAVYGVVAGLGVEHRPVVLVCEDAHWADPSSVELMAGLLDRAPSTPVLLMLVMRPDRQSQGWTLLAEARRLLGDTLVEIPLAPLAEGDSRQVVEHLLAIESLPARLRNMVLAKAEGNPFFLEEVVRMLIDSGVVVERGGRWVATGDIDHLEVPATVHGLLASRIDLLPADVRRAGRVAAVIGRQFPAALLTAVHPAGDRAGSTLHPHIAALESHGMVKLASTLPQVEFAFKHALIHDVMYEGLLKRERRELHGQVAEAIEEMYADRLDEHAPALARHYVEAGDPDRSLRYLLDAGRAALARGARTESHRFYSQAVDVTSAGSDPPSRLEAVLGQAKSGATFVPVPESIALIEGCLPIAEELDDPDRLAGLYVQLLAVRNMQGDSYATQPYRDQLDAAYALVPRLRDPGNRALLRGMMGLARRSADEYAESIEPLTEAVADLEAAGRLSEASFHASMLADSLSVLGSFAEAKAVIADARRLGVDSGDPNAVADADLVRGRISAEEGDLEEALVHTRKGLEAADAIGNTFCSLAGNFMVADQHLRMGDVADAISHLERSTGLAEYCNAAGYDALGQAWLAAARARLGDFDPAEFDEPLAKAVAAGSRSGEAQVRFHRAVAIAGAGRPEQAFDDFEHSLRLFASYGGYPSMARVNHAYGQALEAAGRAYEAAARLREAEEIFTRLGIKPDPANVG
jgi:class 3 adenylate cyclase/tetratricopeptide (TPR) repeat protein